MSDIKLGVLVSLEEGPERAIEQVRGLGFPTCQVGCGQGDVLTTGVAQRLRRVAAQRGVEITSLWVGLPGRTVWDFVEGPTTIGLVPPQTRAARLAALKAGSDFAREAGLPSITTHVGFLPESPADPLYAGVVEALREVARHCAGRGQEFWFETGQETPIALLRVMQDTGAANLGVNLDPANLLMYGKANPIDALDIIGPYVRGVHAKDGEYPLNGRKLGGEKPLGQGRVGFPGLVARLRELGYRGALTIEREISGPQQIADILVAKSFLEGILAGA